MGTRRWYYHALPSYNQYKDTLSVSRQGINLSDEKLIELDNLVSLKIQQFEKVELMKIFKNTY